MNNKKSTKRALLSSVLSLVLCMAMLIGTTFAWFTDNASTGVNTIQSGKLDIALEYSTDDGATWSNAEGKTLNFMAADGREEILWEPGCTYKLPLIRVRNNGNLALKYQLSINGVTGDAKLLEAIDFTANENAIRDFTGTLLTKDAVSDTILIKGHMKEEAGNEYQELRIDGIGITVSATQLTHEYDSYDNQYDDITLVSDADALKAAIAAGKNVMLTNDVALDVNGKAMTVASDAKVLIDLNGNDIIGTTTVTGASQILFEIKGELTVVGDGTIALYDKSGAAFNDAYENAAIYVNGGVANLNEGMIVCTSVGEAMAYAADAVGGNSVINVNGATLYSSYIGVRSFPTVSGKTNTVNYNSGVVYGGKNGYDIWTQAGSGTSVVNIADGITYTYEDQWGGMYYIEDAAAIVSTSTGLATAIENGGEVILAADITGVDANTAITVVAGKDVTLDLNGHRLSATADKTGNQELFLVKGTMTVKNGSLELVAQNNQAWNAMATIFDVTGGGVLKVDGVTANVAGTDMNFFVHLNNWGSATLEMTNCDITTTYVAVRAFNSGPDMNTITIKDTDFHNGRMFWVHNYTSEGKDDSTLTLDIYGNNNTSDSAKPVRFGFSNSVYYDINGNLIP